MKCRPKKLLSDNIKTYGDIIRDYCERRTLKAGIPTLQQKKTSTGEHYAAISAIAQFLLV